MYLMINGNRHTVSRRIVKSNEIRYLTVTPEPAEVTGKIQTYDNNGFLIAEDNADDFLRSVYSGTLLVLTNTPQPVPYEPTEEEIAGRARTQRDQLLAETDWTQVLDAPISAECRESFRVYRQALRDITEQEGFPLDIIWPEMPEVVKADPDPVDTAVDVLLGGDA
jgi:hypothetical protein